MARGGYGSGGIPLQDRVRGTVPSAPAPAATDACPARHCWVAVPVDGSHPRPGLLLEWRKVERGRFEGLVTHAALLLPAGGPRSPSGCRRGWLTQADESGT